MTKSKWVRSGFAVALGLVFLAAGGVLAAAPQVLVYMGHLSNEAGGPVDGEVVMTFSLYAAPVGGEPLWTSTLPVEVVQGDFVVELGRVAPLSPAVFDGGLRYLGIRVGEGDAAEELEPRRPLGGSPYALLAQMAEGLAPQAMMSLAGQLAAAPEFEEFRDEVTGPAGPPGAAGVNCYDATGDTNGDGALTAADCVPDVDEMFEEINGELWCLRNCNDAVPGDCFTHACDPLTVACEPTGLALDTTPCVLDGVFGRCFSGSCCVASGPEVADGRDNDCDGRVDESGPPCNDCPEGTEIPEGWVYVPAGEFWMGSPETEEGRQPEETRHRVRFTRPFLLQAHEVTQAEWTATMGYAAAHHAACGLDCPVESITWYHALIYANRRSRAEGLPECYVLGDCQPDPAGSCGDVAWVGPDCTGYRLPTEAEWEYAARAGTTDATYNQDEPWRIVAPNRAPALDPIAWYAGNSAVQYPSESPCRGGPPGTLCGPHPVVTKRPNALGLYDMLGNVSEWVWDGFHDEYGGLGDPYTPVVDPVVLSMGTGSHRGGSWIREAAEVRSAARAQLLADYRETHLGMRLARSLP